MADESMLSGKKKWLVIALASFLLIGGGLGVLLLLSSDELGNESASPKIESIAAEPIAYVNIAQPFVFNVTGDDRHRMVQIKVQLMVRGDKNEQLARYHSPLVESSLLSTFASATVEQLRTTMGRVELRDKATGDLRTALIKVVGEPVIERVLFTDFVMQ